MDDIHFTLNGTAYTIGECTFIPGFVWSSANEESDAFPTAAEAQQDAMRHALQEDAEETESDWVEYQRMAFGASL